MASDESGGDMFDSRDRVLRSGNFHSVPHLCEVVRLRQVNKQISIPPRAVKLLHFVHSDIGVAKLSPINVQAQLPQPDKIKQQGFFQSEYTKML